MEADAEVKLEVPPMRPEGGDDPGCARAREFRERGYWLAALRFPIFLEERA